MLPLLLLLLLLLGSDEVEGAEYRISSESTFSTFVSRVNGGTTYSGTTVYLDSDLSLSSYTINPIGNSTSYYFRGTFDAQGYVINDLKINSSSLQYTGLFGYSKGLAIKNVILDSSCSITNTYIGSSSRYVGGIISYCYAGSGECNIENNVIVADVTFSGNISSYTLYLGGVAGYLSSSYGYSAYMKNCANYGSVTHSGISYNSYIGGIVGYTSSSYYKYLYNCINYGTITHSGTTSTTLRLGGVLGHSYYTYIENCVGAGEISSAKTNYIGSIAGYAGSYTYINYCYYTSELGGYKMYGAGTPESSSYTLSYDSTTFELSDDASVGSYTGSSLVGALNAHSDYYALRDYSKWLLNKESKTVTFTINGRTSPIIMDHQVILLPSLATEGSLWFNGWYSDSGCTNILESYEINENTDLYGKFEENANSYTISFETRREGVSVEPITSQFGVVVSLPSDLVKDDCSIAFWETEYGDNAGLSLTMPAHIFTLYAVWKCTHITTVDDFIDFSKVVNSGTDDYSGTTVYLNSDLSLSGKTLGPIGNDDYYFIGTFDGQGHIISGLSIASSSYYTGLFGYSEGLTIKNIVLDSSCSVTSSYRGSNDVYAGGIIGYCYAEYEECNIENSVNMAVVAFSGSISSYTLYLGGFAGYIYYSSYDAYVKNCANYGSVTHSGTTYYSFVGGIVGYLEYSEPYYIYIYNCLNYGTITHIGTTSSGLCLGGVVGYSYYTYIENCVSAGEVSTQNTPSDSYIGSIAGYAGSYTYINYCYYTSELGGYKMYGAGTPESSSYTLSYDNTTFELSDDASVGSYTGSSLVGALNAAVDYYALRDYSKWLLNKGNKAVTFTINDRTNPITMNHQIILLPSLATEEGLWFDGWYSDNGYANILKSYEINDDTDLYGKTDENTNSYTISFDTRREGVSVEPITSQFGVAVPLPSDLEKDDCNVASWETEYGDNVGLSLTMPAHIFTLYAVWKCTHITTVDDFIDFSKVVNSGTDDYSGTTVFLDIDLSLPETNGPIGNDDYYFIGTFDGQGHIISDLKINSSSLQFTGLFGYSRGLTIKNIVLDSSCSVTNRHIGSDSVYIGGIIGYCYTEYEECNIENSVNMADVTFSGGISSTSIYSLYIGGVVGCFYSSSSSYDAYVKNCANYGSVTHSGVSRYSYIGGIVGYTSNSYYKYLYNCLNYGTITHSGTTSSTLYLGGVLGYSYYTYIENCVSAGEVSTQNTPSDSYIGSIAGDVSSGTYINYCYYTSELGGYKMYGAGTPVSTSYTLSYDNTTFELSDDVSVGSYTGSSLINALNAYSDYYFLRDYSKWLLNKGNKAVTFTINDRTSPITMNSQIILIPSLATEEGLWFNGWYSDNGYANILESYEINENTDLYGKFEENANYYTITFNISGGEVSVVPQTAHFGTVVQLPSECIPYWETEYGDNVGLSLTMPARNITLYAVWRCTRITTVDDFIDFSKVVNSGTNYLGSTVYLDSDLSLSGETLEPIGNSSGYYFRGTFDGQGHIISDLKINSSSLQYTGLFGCSRGLTIKNVVLDSSCSITNTYVGSSTLYVGGIIGYCYADSGECNIENNVNVADVTFSKSISGYTLYLGGVAGYLYRPSSGYNIYVKNCANYGSVTHSGTSYNSYIGGIAGYSGNPPSYNYFYNCLNYGTITHSGTTSYMLRLGGIVGYIKDTRIENCVSAGKISSTGTVPTSYNGTIVGQVGSATYISYCYYTSDVGVNSIYGTGTPSTTGTPTTSSSVDSTLVSNLNSYASGKGWNKWLLNANNVTVNFTVNYRDILSLSSQIILLPNLVGSGSTAFSGWYKSTLYNEFFQSANITAATALHELYGVIINVTFDTNGGSHATFSSKNVIYNNTYRELPESAMEGYTFTGWSTEDDKNITNETIVSFLYNHTLYAQWKANNYIVAFDANGGTPQDSIETTFDSAYGKLPESAMEGYTCIGWFTEDSKNVTNETIVKTPYNHILYAQWKANNYIVAFDANGGTPQDSIEATFDSAYGKLPEPTRTGYTFAGWFTEEDEIITSEINVSIPYNHILYAQWEANNYTVTFDYGDGTVTEYVLEFEGVIPYPADPEREGYTFDGWDRNDTTVPAGNLTITAQWVSYTIVIVFGKTSLGGVDALERVKELIGDEDAKIEVEDGSGDSVICTIKLLDEKDEEDVKTIVKKIVNSEDLDPAVESVKINGKEWSDDDNSGGSNIMMIIVIAAVAAVVVIAVVVIIIVVILVGRRRRKLSTRVEIDKNKVCRRVVNQDVDAVDASTFKSHFTKRKKIYPEDYEPPQSIVDALTKAGLGDEPANEAARACECIAGLCKGGKGTPSNFTVEDAAAVCLYTYDSGDGLYEKSPHSLLNDALRADDNKGSKIRKIVKVRDVLYLMMTALRKLPVKKGVTLYKGTKEHLDEELYREGGSVVWPRFSSVSTSRDSVETFLINSNSTTSSILSDEIELDEMGTLFIIEGGWGYDIRPYSQCPDEEEILLEPERRFDVVSLEESNGILLVTLKMTDANSILPDVFGDLQK